MNPDAHTVWRAPRWALAVLLALTGCGGREDGAPPELQYFSERRSCLGVSGSLISAVNIVGTPQKIDTFCPLMSASAAFGSKRTCWITSAARRRPNSMLTVSA